MGMGLYSHFLELLVSGVKSVVLHPEESILSLWGENDGILHPNRCVKRLTYIQRF